MKKIKCILVMLVLSLTVLSGCSLPKLSSKSTRNDVKITTLSTSESQIISHMLRLLIEHDTRGKIKPALVNNLESDTIQHNVLINGGANISDARYSGTDLMGALKGAPVKNPKKAVIAIQQGFKKRFDQTFFDSYGFANTYAFMVTKKAARKYHLEIVSDLAEHSRDLRLGMDSSWMNRKGDDYEGLKKECGFDSGAVRLIQIGLAYDALNSERLNVALSYSTGGRIVVYDLKVLRDGKRFSPPYAASTVTTSKLLWQHPELKTAINKLIGKISTSEMQHLSYEADGKGREPAVVAEESLKKHHYLDKQKGGHK